MREYKENTNEISPKDSLSDAWYAVMGNLKWAEYAIRCKLFNDAELNHISQLLEDYAKKGKAKAFKK